jgi:GntR family transcriptional regulator, transcriptional repressor for pyruvate dehydrogenase complex
MSGETLADGLAGRLLQQIIDGHHGPDALLPPEADIADDASVSRLTVREAVKTLRAKNVLRIERGRGTYVNPASRWTDLDALVRAATAQLPAAGGLVPRRLIEARRVIEVGAAELAATHRTAADIAALEAETAKMRAAAALQDTDAFVVADMAFHTAVLDAAGNVFLGALLEPLGQLLVEARRQTSAYAEIRLHAIEHHEAILDAIRAGAPDRAALAMRAHMDQTEQDLCAIVLRDASSASPRAPDS